MVNQTNVDGVRTGRVGDGVWESVVKPTMNTRRRPEV